MHLNEYCKAMVEIPMFVDKFHFRNHVDPWCVKNCDPFKESEPNKVNTPVCEQMFTKINRHRNCKSMNEARYWFFNIDLHNLEVERLDSSVPDPRGEFRRTQFKVIPVDFMNLPDKQTEQLHQLSEQLQSAGEVFGRESCQVHFMWSRIQDGSLPTSTHEREA